ncbi:DUF3108 domain-containing protein [Maricaulis sp.]|uniref:DUF3108 domain-containing protein n=1 Tax=Maricaulis sp. TaxID=1486257 RepID=UPI003A940268
MKHVWLAGAAALGLVLSGSVGNADDAADISSAAPPAGTHGVTVQYSGSVLIFQVADISINSEFADDTYQAAARFTAAGLAALFTDADIEAGVSGYRDGAELQPYRYSHLNHASSKNRIVGIDFPDGVAMPDVNPPFGNMGEPAASDADRIGARDPISTLLAMGLGAVSSGSSHCDGRLPVFDGRARYNLRFEDGGLRDVRTRAWSGEALVCRAYYEPISGYEADEFPSADDIAEPIDFWLAPVNGGEFYVPVKIRTNAGFGGVTVTARSMETY